MTSILVQWLRSQKGALFLEECLGANQETEAETQVSFWEYLLRQTGKGSATLQLLIHDQDWEGLRGKLQSMYRNFCKEHNRDLLYQRVRQVLHKADPSFGYTPGKHHSSYGATAPDSPVVGSYDQLRDQGCAPQCPDMQVEEIRTTQGILTLAASFREQVAAHHGADYQISLRTLCEFIRAHFDVQLIYGAVEDAGSVSLDVQESEEGQVPQCLEHPDSFSTLVDYCISADTLRHSAQTWLDEAHVKKIAEAVAWQLQQKDLFLVVCLLVFCELTLAQAAQVLGYAGPSGVKALFQKANTLIAQASSLYEGLAADDLNPELYRRFLEFLLALCKRDDCSRYVE